MVFHMYIGTRADPFVDKILISSERLCHLAHLLQVQNIYLKSDFYIFLPVLYMYIAPSQGQTIPRGQHFYFNINLLSLWSYAVSFFH